MRRLGRSLGTQHHVESPPELGRHGAVEDEVDAGIEEHQCVHQVADADVDADSEAVVDGSHRVDDPLGQFGGHEADGHSRQHGGIPVVLPGRRRFAQSLRAFQKGRTAALPRGGETLSAEADVAVVGASHGGDEEPAEHRDAQGSENFDGDAVDEEGGHFQGHGPVGELEPPRTISCPTHDVGEIVGRAEEDRSDEDEEEDSARRPHRAQLRPRHGVVDGQAAHEGESDQQEAGGGVTCDDDVGVHQQEHHPAQLVSVRRAVDQLVVHVHVERVHEVGGHFDDVGDGDGGEQEVGWRSHRRTGQDNDGEEVGDDPAETDASGNGAVVAVIVFRHLAQEVPGTALGREGTRTGVAETMVHLTDGKPAGVVSVGHVHRIWRGRGLEVCFLTQYCKQFACQSVDSTHRKSNSVLYMYGVNSIFIQTKRKKQYVDVAKVLVCLKFESKAKAKENPNAKMTACLSLKDRQEMSSISF